MRKMLSQMKIGTWFDWAEGKSRMMRIRELYNINCVSEYGVQMHLEDREYEVIPREKVIHGPGIHCN